MGRLKNIANSWQRLALPSGGWGVLLLTAFMLLAGSRYASAQNNSANPYINSTHLYRVAMGNSANTVEWQLFDDIDDANNNTNADYSSTASQAWATPAKVGINAQITIEFVNTFFTNTTTTWYLVYNENDPSHNCVARRRFDITPAENLFNLSVFNYDPDCNSYTGLVWTNDDDITQSDTMTVELSVEMQKATDHGVFEWSCNGTVSLSAGYIIPANPLVFIPTANRSGTSTNSGNYVISSVSGAGFTLKVTGLDPASTVGDRVIFYVQVIGPPTTDSNVTLTISNGQGVSGNNFSVVTNENSNTDNEQTRLLYAIPNTSLLVAN